MRRIVKHGAVGLGVSVLTAVAVIGNLGHETAVADSQPAVYVESSSAPTATTTAATDPASLAVEATFGTSRSDITRPAASGPMNVARDGRQLALATQAQLVSSEQLRILQERQIAAAKKNAAEEEKKAAEQAKEVAARIQAEADAQAAAQQQQTTDQAVAAAEASAAEQAQTQAQTQAQSYSGSDPHTIARQMMQQKYGWGSDQYSCLDSIYTAESNWKTTAENPSSGAYGIPQSLPGSKMAAAGSDWRTNPATQISWGLSYIKSRYGTPCQALSFRRGHNYY